MCVVALLEVWADEIVAKYEQFSQCSVGQITLLFVFAWMGAEGGPYLFSLGFA